MAQKRTVQDIYALITPNTPSDEEFSEGEEVQVQHRQDRLQDLEWVSSFEEENSHYVATLTEVGAAVINYANRTMAEGDFGSEIERGAGRFVTRARANYLEEERWEITNIDDNEVVLENQLGEERKYEREAVEATA